MEPLRTARLVLREFDYQDEQALNAIFSDQSLFEYNDDPPPTEGAGELIRRLKSDADDRRDVPQPQFEYMFAVAEKAGGPLFGWVNLNLAPGRRPTVGVVLAREWHGQGFAAEAVRKALAFAFQLPGVDHVDAKCHMDNASSIALFERLGGVAIDVSAGDSRWYRLTAD